MSLGHHIGTLHPTGLALMSLTNEMRDNLRFFLIVEKQNRFQTRAYTAFIG